MPDVRLKIISWSVGQQSLSEADAGFLLKLLMCACVCVCVCVLCQPLLNFRQISVFWTSMVCVCGGGGGGGGGWWGGAAGGGVHVCPDGILTWLADF